MSVIIEVIKKPEVIAAIITSMVSLLILLGTSRSNKKISREIEVLKVETSKNFLRFSLYQNKNFEKQIELWENLIDLETFLDKLWKDNNYQNRKKASSYSANAKINLKKSRIFLDESLYKEIERIISILDNYLNGKQNLEDVYYSYTNDNREILIQNNVNINSILRGEYKVALEKLVNHLRFQYE